MSILVATDFSAHSLSAVRFACALARKESAELIVMSVADLAEDNAWRILVQAPGEVEESAKDQAMRELTVFFEDGVPEELRPEKYRFETTVGNPIEEILKKAAALNVAMIVSGTRGAGVLQHVFLGSVANRLVRQSDRPVILVPPTQPGTQIKTIVAPVDFSDASRASLDHAATMARRHGAALKILHAYVVPELTGLQTSVSNVSAQLKQITDAKRQQIAEFAAPSNLAGIEHTVTVFQQTPHMAITDFAEQENADLICMGSHGRRGWSRFFLGNTAERVLRHAPCAILTVRVRD